MVYCYTFNNLETFVSDSLAIEKHTEPDGTTYIKTKEPLNEEGVTSITESFFASTVGSLRSRSVTPEQILENERAEYIIKIREAEILGEIEEVTKLRGEWKVRKSELIDARP